MSELCRVIIVALLLIDIQRGILVTSSGRSSAGAGAGAGAADGGGVSVVVGRNDDDDDDDDERRHGAAAISPARNLSHCRPPSSDTLWLRLQQRSTGGQVEQSDDDVPTTLDGRRPATSGVGRQRRAVRHGRHRRRRRGGRGRRRRVHSTAAAANSTSTALDAIRRDALRRRRGGGRRSDGRGSGPSGRRTAWQCGLDKYWRRTGPGVFPAYVQTGRCSTPTCMMGLYECRARRYAVGVLRRRRGRCVPLPLTGVVNATSSSEELWTPSHVHVVVACECSARRATGVFQRAAVTSAP